MFRHLALLFFQRLPPQNFTVYLFQVVRVGLDVDIAPDAIANQLNARNGALILQVC